MNKSIWISKNNNKFKDKEIKNETDILIIGGGITGLTVSYFLKNIDKKVMLIEKNNLCSGITERTTAKINYLQGSFRKINDSHGIEKAGLYLKSQIEATNIIKTIVNKYKIDCDLEKVSSILFAVEKKNKYKVKQEKYILNKLGVKTKKVNNDNIAYGIKVDNTYQFNPLKYLDNLIDIVKDKIDIHEGIRAIKYTRVKDGYIVNTDECNIKCHTLVLACHYPFMVTPGLIPLKTYIEKEYVNAKSNCDSKLWNAINVDKDLHSIRYYKDYLIYGSNSRKSTNKMNYYRNYIKSINDFKTYFNLDSEYTWINQDIYSNDYVPFIGELDRNLYIACGYNAWGMTNGTIAGKVISDLIMNNYSEYEELFNPNRINLTLFINSFLNSFSYLKGYIQAIFNTNNPKYIMRDGILYGVYTDDDGVKHKTKLICPHMKSFLVFNKADLTWDCPLHGSRFTIDGKLITGPSTKDICK